MSLNRELINIPKHKLLLAQGKQLKKDALSIGTQDSIRNATKKSQLTHANINFALEESGDAHCQRTIPSHKERFHIYT